MGQLWRGGWAAWGLGVRVSIWTPGWKESWRRAILEARPVEGLIDGEGIAKRERERA